MADIEIRNRVNQKVGDITLEDSVFRERPKTQAVYEEVKRYLASLRGGTHATKTRAMVSGAGRKLWKQKGTGRARVGSIRSPLWRHGGTTHGPQPHTYDLDIPRKVKKLAMRVALSQKLKANAVLVLDSIDMPECKTKQVAELVRSLELRRSVLIVEHGKNENLRLAARNHPQVKVVSPSMLSVYDVLKYDRLIFTRETAAKVTEIFPTMNELLEMVRKPHITEKTTRLKEVSETLCFRVRSDASKVDIRRAVERIFDVKVMAVRVLRVHGKMKRNRGFAGYRPDWRKAYVRLQPGGKTIEYFEGL